MAVNGEQPELLKMFDLDEVNTYNEILHWVSTLVFAGIRRFTPCWSANAAYKVFVRIFLSSRK
ncbi:MAG TPA: hypothetical protein DEP05_04580 [Betaproteobacteria bacterium]|nr:hypothetical protein [Betaproteobacteria bacterium]